jgi:hypothetical protein
LENDVDHLIVKMKEDKKMNGGSWIGIGAAIGLAISYALGSKSENFSQILGLGIAIGVAVGAVIDFINRGK